LRVCQFRHSRTMLLFYRLQTWRSIRILRGKGVQTGKGQLAIACASVV